MTRTRTTAQKLLVSSLMRGNTSHPTADGLYEAARKCDPHISRGTVYRILGALSDSGEIRRLPMPEGPDHFDSNTSDHYHFVCRCCHGVFDTSMPYNSKLNSDGSILPEGFVNEWHRLIFVGLCANCK